MLVQQIHFCHKVMLVNRISISVMERSSWLQSNSIRCETAAFCRTNRRLHHIVLRMPLVYYTRDGMLKILVRLLRCPPWFSGICCCRRSFLPDDVSLQANDPLNDLLLGILGWPEETTKHIFKAMSKKQKQQNKSHTSVTLKDMRGSSVRGANSDLKNSIILYSRRTFSNSRPD